MISKRARRSSKRTEGSGRGGGGGPFFSPPSAFRAPFVISRFPSPAPAPVRFGCKLSVPLSLWRTSGKEEGGDGEVDVVKELVGETLRLRFKVQRRVVALHQVLQRPSL